ncbi:hypothetical protein QE152_g13636 [Popillia japonica]|uniref:C2H2-type domain-containing protein n=1 Tax=Popillia japonica TaxID=7064 RepID=A0AAW1LDT9_POPJA
MHIYLPLLVIVIVRIGSSSCSDIFPTFVPLIVPRDLSRQTDPSSPCTCHDITYHAIIEMECKCSGNGLYIPANLTHALVRLLITDGDIEVITRNDLDPYRETLSEVKIVSCNLIEIPDFSHLNENTVQILISVVFEKVFCTVCCKIIPCEKKFQVDQHVKTSSHAAKLKNCRLKNQSILQCIELGTKKTDQKIFNEELCRALVSADIPLNKLNNTNFKSFLKSYCTYNIPDESTLRKGEVNSTYIDTDLEPFCATTLMRQRTQKADSGLCY